MLPSPEIVEVLLQNLSEYPVRGRETKHTSLTHLLCSVFFFGFESLCLSMVNVVCF